MSDNSSASNRIVVSIVTGVSMLILAAVGSAIGTSIQSGPRLDRLESDVALLLEEMNIVRQPNVTELEREIIQDQDIQFLLEENVRIRESISELREEIEGLQ